MEHLITCSEIKDLMLMVILYEKYVAFCVWKSVVLLRAIRKEMDLQNVIFVMLKTCYDGPYITEIATA